MVSELNSLWHLVSHIRKNILQDVSNETLGRAAGVPSPRRSRSDAAEQELQVRCVGS
jgi:hypothetical protein